MPMSDYASHDGLGLAELVRRGQVTPLELCEEALARIARVDPALHAVTARLDEKARAQARAPLPEGPFRGVPFALKDLLADLAGTPLTSGSRFERQRVCQHDSELVRRYRAAGLVFVARTASPELGLTPVTEPELYGPTGTPWAPGRAAGGSSGGSAALVGAGALPMAHGGDGGGSLRMPASCCGVFGFKPTRARTPSGPDVGEHWHGLAIEHAITRSVRDSAALLDATCAPEDGAPYVAPPPARPFLDEVGAPPGRLRIAWTATPFLPSTVHGDAVAAVEDAARLCTELGHEVAPVAPPIDAGRFARGLLAVIAGETAAEVLEMERRQGRRHRRGEIEAGTELVAMYGRALSALDLCTGLAELRALGRVMAEFHRRWDVLLTPTLAFAPPLHGALRSRGVQEMAERAMAASGVSALMRLPGLAETMAARVFDFMPWTPLANATGAPSMSVPLWWNREDLPVGVMFTGRFGDDATLFRLAAQLEQARPWAGRRPVVHAFD
jgi:amidase